MAEAINSVGLIVGDSFFAAGEHAVSSAALTRRAQDLGTLGADHSYATAVNDLG